MNEEKNVIKHIALVDMDGTLADYEGAMRRDLEFLRSPKEEPIIKDLHSFENLAYAKARMDMIKRVPGWWLKLERIEQNFQVLNLLIEIGFEVNILTKGPRHNSQAWAEKLQWCDAQKELHDKNVHITVNKGLFYGRILFDDFPDYLNLWLANRKRGLGIMPVTPENKDFRHPNVVHWTGKNIDEIHNAIQLAYNRKYKGPLNLNLK